MAYELVKFSVDMFAPGAELNPLMSKYLSTYMARHSRRTLYPVKPLSKMIDGDRVTEDFFHIRATAIGDGVYGLAEGKIDAMLAGRDLQEVFGFADLERIAAHAMNISQPYGAVLHRTYACWADLYHAEEQGLQRFQFIKHISIDALGTPTKF